MAGTGQVGQLGLNLIGGKAACRNHLHQVAGFSERASIGIDEQASLRHQGIIGLAHIGPKSANQIDVRTRAYPVRLYEWFFARGRTADDIGR